MKTCKICGSEFEPTGQRQFYCSNECKNKHRRDTRQKVQPIKYSCQICGNDFIQKRKDKVTCSAACSQKLWVKNNPEKNWERHNGEHRKEMRKDWIKNNYGKYRDVQNKSKRKRYRENLKYRLNNLIGNAIRLKIHDKNCIKWEHLVGYDVDTLINHLKLTLPNDVSWNDYLNGGYHIDHIIPQDLFDFDSHTDPEFKKCWHYRNLRIITDNENLTKLANFEPELIKKYKIEDLLPINFDM